MSFCENVVVAEIGYEMLKVFFIINRVVLRGATLNPIDSSLHKLFET